MKTSELFKSKYFKATDFEDGPETLTVKGAAIEIVGDKKEQKLGLTFEESDKILLVNKTNSTTITKLYGDDTDDWIGERITLGSREVDVKGEQVLAVRVSSKKPGKSAPAAKPEPTGAGIGPDDQPAGEEPW